MPVKFGTLVEKSEGVVDARNRRAFPPYPPGCVNGITGEPSRPAANRPQTQPKPPPNYPETWRPANVGRSPDRCFLVRPPQCGQHEHARVAPEVTSSARDRQESAIPGRYQRKHTLGLRSVEAQGNRAPSALFRRSMDRRAGSSRCPRRRRPSFEGRIQAALKVLSGAFP
jgi:hypothetical protein